MADKKSSEYFIKVDALQKSYPEIEDYNATSGDAHTHIGAHLYYL